MLAMMLRAFSAYSASNRTLAKQLFSRANKTKFHSLPFKALLLIYPLPFLSSLLVAGALIFGYGLEFFVCGVELLTLLAC